MSYPESHDRDLSNHEEKQELWRMIDNEQLAEFREMIEEAFAFANNEHLNEDDVFIELRSAFKSYFDKCEMLISKGYKLEELKSGKRVNLLVRGE